MAAVRSSPSSLCCRVKPLNKRWELSFDEKRGCGKGGGGRKRLKGAFPKHCNADPESSATLLHSSVCCLEGKMHPFPNRGAFQRQTSVWKTLLKTFSESFPIIFVRAGEAKLLKIHTSPGAYYVSLWPQSMQKSNDGPAILKVTLKTPKYKTFSLFHGLCLDLSWYLLAISCCALQRRANPHLPPSPLSWLCGTLSPQKQPQHQSTLAHTSAPRAKKASLPFPKAPRDCNLSPGTELPEWGWERS